MGLKEQIGRGEGVGESMGASSALLLGSDRESAAGA